MLVLGDVAGDVDVETDAIDDDEAFDETESAPLSETLGDPLLDGLGDCETLKKLDCVD